MNCDYCELMFTIRSVFGNCFANMNIDRETYSEEKCMSDFHCLQHFCFHKVIFRTLRCLFSGLDCLFIQMDHSLCYLCLYE